jgi:hypothetical protein
MRKYLILLVLLLPACLHQGQYSNELFSAGSSINLCLDMPQNKLVFENMSPLVYEALWNHFNRVGYHLVDKKRRVTLFLLRLKTLARHVNSYHPICLPIQYKCVLSWSVSCLMQRIRW